jgi:large subunit ribosomal protein L21
MRNRSGPPAGAEPITAAPHSKQSELDPKGASVRRGQDLSGGESMYAVIRAGGKQYRVAPGDVIRVERMATGTDGQVEFADVLAVSPAEGTVTKAGSDVKVVGQVVEEGRGAKILVFHYKRKKQYKKLRGHRQDFSAVRITEIAVDGQSFKAPELPKKEPKVKKAAPVAELKEVPAAKKKAAKKTAAKKSVTKKK